jgi:hypothetical protein
MALAAGQLWKHTGVGAPSMKGRILEIVDVDVNGYSAYYNWYGAGPNRIDLDYLEYWVRKNCTPQFDPTNFYQVYVGGLCTWVT